MKLRISCIAGLCALIFVGVMIKYLRENRKNVEGGVPINNISGRWESLNCENNQPSKIITISKDLTFEYEDHGSDVVVGDNGGWPKQGKIELTENILHIPLEYQFNNSIVVEVVLLYKMVNVEGELILLPDNIKAPTTREEVANCNGILRRKDKIGLRLLNFFKNK